MHDSILPCYFRRLEEDVVFFQREEHEKTPLKLPKKQPSRHLTRDLAAQLAFSLSHITPMFSKPYIYLYHAKNATATVLPYHAGS
jgi:hypothetical protein